MQIESVRLGTIDIEEEKIINFPQGILGFPEEQRFALIPAGENNPFYFLQSTIDPVISFVVTEPHLFFHDYEVGLSDEIVEQLLIERSEDVAIYSIVTLREPFKQSTTNLQAPLVVNVKKFTAVQFILGDERYATKQPLFPTEEG